MKYRYGERFEMLIAQIGLAWAPIVSCLFMGAFFIFLLLWRP